MVLEISSATGSPRPQVKHLVVFVAIGLLGLMIYTDSAIPEACWSNLQS